MRCRGMLAGALALVLWAGGAGAHNHDRDMAERLQALGEVLPLQDVLEQVARDYPGQVLKVDFEREDDDDDCLKCRGRWIYELKLMQDQGRLTKLKVDARTGEALWVATKPLRRGGDHP